jgi:hypothetical protein
MRLSLLLAGLAACSSVTVRKIPWRGDYTSWDNERQREADGIAGERFYLPWPHLVITKAFPVDEDSCFISATLTGDGRYVNFDNGILKGLNARPPAGSGPAPAPPAVSEQGSRLGGAEDAPEASGGTSPLPLTDFMSIEYLPNEREQYAVAVTPGLFPADPKGELANRWMAGAQAKGVPLPELAQGVLDDVLPRLERVLPSLEQAPGTVAPGAPEGTRVTVRVHAVRYARPGVYPLLHADDSLRASIGSLGNPGSRLGAAADDAVPSCSPELRWPVQLRVGSFAVQTYAERYLDVVAPVAAPARPAVVATPYQTGCAAAPTAPNYSGQTLPGLPGRLVVRVLPWAAVYLDGRMVGTTPFEPMDVPSGPHCLELVNEELHVKRSFNVDVRAGETAMVQEKLEL